MMMKQIGLTISGMVLAFMLASCGEFGTPGEGVAVSVDAVPSTAGFIETEGEFTAGDSLTITAVSNSGWQFSGWEGDIDGNENPIRIELEDDLNVVANFELFQTGYSLQMTLTDGDRSAEAEFGQFEGATDGYDSGIDREAPPLPPGDLPDLRFLNDGRDLLSDFRNAFADDVEWTLSIRVPEDGETMLSWEAPSDSPNGSLELLDPDEESRADLSDEGAIELNGDDSGEWSIRFLSEGAENR